MLFHLRIYFIKILPCLRIASNNTAMFIHIPSIHLVIFLCMNVVLLLNTLKIRSDKMGHLLVHNCNIVRRFFFYWYKSLYIYLLIYQTANRVSLEHNLRKLSKWIVHFIKTTNLLKMLLVFNSILIIIVNICLKMRRFKSSHRYFQIITDTPWMNR